MTAPNEKTRPESFRLMRHIAVVAGYFALSLLPSFAVLGAYVSFTRATALLGHPPIVMVNDPKHLLFNDTLYQAASTYVFLSVLVVPLTIPFWLYSTFALGKVLALKLRWLAWALYFIGWVALGLVMKQNPGNITGWLED